MEEGKRIENFKLEQKRPKGARGKILIRSEISRQRGNGELSKQKTALAREIKK